VDWLGFGVFDMQLQDGCKIGESGGHAHASLGGGQGCAITTCFGGADHAGEVFFMIYQDDGLVMQF
jgi:hypothetical protein